MPAEPARILEWNIGMLLRAPYQTVGARLHEAIAAAGFTDLQPAHHAVLQHLQNEGIRLTEIARRAQLTKQTISLYVNDLERLGYLSTARDPSDGRARLVLKTQRGREVEQVAELAMRSLEQAWRTRLGDAGYQQLRALLGRLSDSVDD